jgi:hypothetical protein
MHAIIAVTDTASSIECCGTEKYFAKKIAGAKEKNCFMPNPMGCTVKVSRLVKFRTK